VRALAVGKDPGYERRPTATAARIPDLSPRPPAGVARPCHRAVSLPQPRSASGVHHVARVVSASSPSLRVLRVRSAWQWSPLNNGPTAEKPVPQPANQLPPNSQFQLQLTSPNSNSQFPIHNPTSILKFGLGSSIGSRELKLGLDLGIGSWELGIDSVPPLASLRATGSCRYTLAARSTPP
jgi:hypothetical protein